MDGWWRVPGILAVLFPLIFAEHATTHTQVR
jgi:hypothetical protein